MIGFFKLLVIPFTIILSEQFRVQCNIAAVCSVPLLLVHHTNYTSAPLASYGVFV